MTNNQVPESNEMPAKQESSTSLAEMSPKPWWKKLLRQLFVAMCLIIVLFFMVLIAASLWVKHDEAKAEKEAQEVARQKEEAAKAEHTASVTACRKVVTEKAKYPGAVSFPDSIETNVLVNERGNNVYTGVGDVDFPNAFGTPVRMRYICYVEYEKDGKFRQSDAIVSNLRDPDTKTGN